MIYQIENEKLTARINDLGAELISVQNKEGKEYIFQPSPLWQGQAKNLFPNVGIAKDDYTIIRGKKYPMFQHGFVKDRVFKLMSKNQSEVVFTLEDDKDTRQYLPYCFRLEIAFRLEENKVVQTYQVTNTDKEKIYFGIACHTGFKTSSDSYIDFGINDEIIEVCREDMKYLTGEERVYSIEKGIVPVDEAHFRDGAHILRGFKQKRLKLENPSLHSTVEIDFRDFNYITLWSTPDAKTVLCMMPWCALPDTKDTDHIFENKKGNISLEPGEIFKAIQYFTFKDKE